MHMLEESLTVFETGSQMDRRNSVCGLVANDNSPARDMKTVEPLVGPGDLSVSHGAHESLLGPPCTDALGGPVDVNP